MGQDATPAAGDLAGGQKETFLFVQRFASGTLTPRGPTTPDAGMSEGGTSEPEGNAEYGLALAQGLGPSRYFSDRPERIVGTVPTAQFLDALGSTPANPPNAALVGDLGGGDEEVLVVELLAARYDEATHTVTYDVRILAEHQRVDMAFRTNLHPGSTHPGATYGSSHLFLDDRADASIVCLQGWEGRSASMDVGRWGPMPFCWPWNSLGCWPCRDQGRRRCLVEAVRRNVLSMHRGAAGLPLQRDDPPDTVLQGRCSRAETG